MPPVGMPRPDAATQTALISYLETSLDRRAATHPNPGRHLPHRLNRAEYHERDSRSAGARRRRRVSAAAGRLGGRLRQQRRLARRVAVAARALPLSGREDQRARCRRSLDRSELRDVSHSWRRVTDVAERRPASRHARRVDGASHVPARRRVRDQGQAARDQSRFHSRSRVRASARGHCRWRARAARAGWRSRGLHTVVAQRDQRGELTRRAVAGAREGARRGSARSARHFFSDRSRRAATGCSPSSAARSSRRITWAFLTSRT